MAIGFAREEIPRGARMIYRYAWGPRFVVPGLPVLDRKGQLCRVIARGYMEIGRASCRERV